jgi:hypothetical protein
MVSTSMSDVIENDGIEEDISKVEGREYSSLEKTDVFRQTSY